MTIPKPLPPDDPREDVGGFDPPPPEERRGPHRRPAPPAQAVRFRVRREGLRLTVADFGLPPEHLRLVELGEIGPSCGWPELQQRLREKLVEHVAGKLGQGIAWEAIVVPGWDRSDILTAAVMAQGEGW